MQTMNLFKHNWHGNLHGFIFIFLLPSARIQIIQKTKADFSCIPCKRIGTSENKTSTRTIPILQITESSRKMFNNFTGVRRMDWNSLFYMKSVECDVGRKFSTEKQFSVPSWYTKFWKLPNEFIMLEKDFQVKKHIWVKKNFWVKKNAFRWKISFRKTISW